jgi:uncharacterized protein
MESTNEISFNEKVFTDTAALIALVIKRDFLHEQAINIMSELKLKNVKLIITESVLFEFANALSPVEHRSKAVAFIDVIRTLSNIEIVSATDDSFEKSLNLYRARNDKEWSLTDCNSFIVMQELQIRYAFTSDKHFEQAGFIKLLQA